MRGRVCGFLALGLLAATVTTLGMLPFVFAVVQRHAKTASASLDPDDPASPHYSKA